MRFNIFSKAEEEERGKIHDTGRWISFVANNLLAYTAVFQQLLPRFMRTDLVAPKNALMLFRVTKARHFFFDRIYYFMLDICFMKICFIIFYFVGIFAITFSKNDM